jgi:hypothetical protein
VKPFILALGTALALATAVPTVASAQHHRAWHGGHWGGGHWRGGFWRGPRITFGLGFGAPYYAYGSCYRLHRVWTPYGWRWRRGWVC